MVTQNGHGPVGSVVSKEFGSYVVFSWKNNTTIRHMG